MNARSAGSASHADAVDADMTNATRDESATAVVLVVDARRGSSRTRVRARKWRDRGVETGVFWQHVEQKNTDVF